MKLYYYILEESLFSNKATFSFFEIEVDESPKTYSFPNERPPGYYNQRVRKEDIGCLQTDYRKIFLFLLERNDDFAKQEIIKYLEKQIQSEEKKVELLKNKKQLVMDFKEEE